METIIEDWWHDALQVRVLVAGRREIGPWWRYDFTDGIGPWRLYLNDREGSALDLDDGRRFELPADEVVLLPAGLRFRTRAWAPVGHFYVHFDLSGLPPVPAFLFRAPMALPEAGAAKRLIREVSDDMIAESPRLELQWRLKAIVHDVLARLLARVPSGRVGDLEDASPPYGPIRHALRRIQDGYSTRLDNAFLASVCNLSEDHFIRTFRAAMGTTPGQYLAQFRVHVACGRLAAGDETLDSIAVACGFAHRSHLSRTFRATMGMSPGEYRRQVRGQRRGSPLDSARLPMDR